MSLGNQNLVRRVGENSSKLDSLIPVNPPFAGSGSGYSYTPFVIHNEELADSYASVRTGAKSYRLQVTIGGVVYYATQGSSNWEIYESGRGTSFDSGVDISRDLHLFIYDRSIAICGFNGVNYDIAIYDSLNDELRAIDSGLFSSSVSITQLNSGVLAASDGTSLWFWSGTTIKTITLPNSGSECLVDGVDDLVMVAVNDGTTTYFTFYDVNGLYSSFTESGGLDLLSCYQFGSGGCLVGVNSVGDYIWHEVNDLGVRSTNTITNAALSAESIGSGLDEELLFILPHVNGVATVITKTTSRDSSLLYHINERKFDAALGSSNSIHSYSNDLVYQFGVWGQGDLTSGNIRTYLKVDSLTHSIDSSFKPSTIHLKVGGAVVASNSKIVYAEYSEADFTANRVTMNHGLNTTYVAVDVVLWDNTASTGEKVMAATYVDNSNEVTLEKGITLGANQRIRLIVTGAV